MKKKGCLYWIIIGWWWEPLYFIFFSWWRKGSFLNEFFKLLLGIALILCLGTLSFGIAILAFIGIFAILVIKAIIKILVQIYKKFNINADFGKQLIQPSKCSYEHTEGTPSPIPIETNQDTSCNNNAKARNTEQKSQLSNEQALTYARMCNAYLEHQDEMAQYEDTEKS